MAPWPPISRDDLRHAAGSAGFDTVLPLLIRRLVAETGRSVTELDMPGGSGTAASGFDGVVTAIGQTTFVPAGTSVWELSVRRDAQAKADSDYGKRLAGPNGEDPGEITYVQVGLATWTKARTWARERNGEERWRDVRAYNLDTVHAWLDAAPATTAWLAEQLGKALPGVRPAETWWSDTWLPSTHVPLTAEIVLAGRESVASSLMELLSAGQHVITLGGDLRADEVRALIAASLEHSGTTQAEAVKARTLFVTDADSLAQLLGQSQPLVVVLTDAALVSDLPMRHPHQVVVIAPLGAHPDLTVPPVDGEVVEEHLKAAGMARERAYSQGTLARRSFLALRRALAVHPAVLTPAWAMTPDLIRRRLLLLGSWDGTNADDRRMVEECLGRPYADVQEAVIELASAPEAPFLGRLQEQWHLLSPEDAWVLLRRHLTRDDMEAFRRVGVQVLGDRVRLGQDQQTSWTTGDRRRFSNTLREGLAQTLALLGASDTAVLLPGGLTGAGLARLMARELFHQANADSSYALWTSMGEVLPLLAEAAPEEFLQAIRVGLQGQPPLHASMFADGDRNEFGQPRSSPHISFLWAVEVLAWSPDYFDDVVDVLAQLAAIDPGGLWSKRPHSSLTEMLSCWNPNTSADEPQRLRALERLLRNEPDVARRLLLELIPDGRGFQTPHSGPRFQDWKRESHLTHADLTRTVTAVVDLLLGDLGDDPDRHLSLIDKIDDLSRAQRIVFAERLTALGASMTDDGIRARLSDAIREKVARHREYADAGWALPEGELLVIEQAGQALEPHSAVLRGAWLFQSDWVTLGDQSMRDDFTAYQTVLARRRAEAVERILSQGGLPAIAELASIAKYPHVVGMALAEHTAEFDDDMLGWLAEQPSLRNLAFAYLGTRLGREGASLRDALITRVDSPAVQAAILNATDDPPAAWQKLAELPQQVSQHYWRNFVYFGLGTSTDHVLEAARGMIGVGRYVAALKLISLRAKQLDSVEAALVTATACEGLLVGQPANPELPRLAGDDFHRLFTLLARHRDAVGRQRIANLEWQLFPALRFEADAPTLHATLVEEPAFFAELVGHVYKREDEESSSDRTGADHEQRRRIATRAYDVLRSWRRCPGIGPDGAVDPNLLRAWITEARNQLHELTMLRSGDAHIGQALAFAPPDPDGLFPPKAVREVLEELRSDHIDTGLWRGIFNKRGVTSRGLTDGGAQEWTLAIRYREQAEASGAWPRTRKMLRGLAERYEDEARSEDEEAERRRRGLHD